MTSFVAVELLRVGGVAACIAAAVRYSWGDRLHGAWLLFALNALLLLSKDVLFGPRSPELGIHLVLPHARALLVIAGNLATVIAMILLAGAWRASGFAELASRRRRVTAQIVSVLLALATTGWPFLVNLASLRHGSPAAIEHLASDAGDFLTFSLIAPLALVTFALRGGALFWPWLLIVLSKLSWMLFDLILIVHGGRARVLMEVARCLALALLVAAGVTQRRGMQRA